MTNAWFDFVVFYFVWRLMRISPSKRGEGFLLIILNFKLQNAKVAENPHPQNQPKKGSLLEEIPPRESRPTL